jgi:DNA-binding PadR family transcriptional regulator
LTGDRSQYTILDIQICTWGDAMITRLFVLGLLALQPMSGYAIQHYLRLNRAEHWAKIWPGSIHHALKRLLADGLIQLHTTEQTGHRTKALYAITTAGLAEFHRLLEQAWATADPHYPVGLYTALTFLTALPRDTVLTALDAHIATLQTELETWNRGEITRAVQIPPQMRAFVQLSFANGREHMEVDLRFLRALREQLPTLPPFSVSLPSAPEEQGS